MSAKGPSRREILEDKLELILAEGFSVQSVVEGLQAIATRESGTLRAGPPRAGNHAMKWEMSARILSDAVNKLYGQHCGDVP